MIGEAELLGFKKLVVLQTLTGCRNPLRDFHNIVQLFDEPGIDTRQVMNVLNGTAAAERFGDGEYAEMRRLPEFGVDVFKLESYVADQSGNVDLEHSESLLQGFFESAADRHHLADRLHARPHFLRYAAEL